MANVLPLGRAAQLGWLLPWLAATSLCFLMRRELPSLFAPLLGPWAGLAYGHHDCTMGTVMPAVSWGAALLGAVAIPTALRARSPRLRRAGRIATLLWAVLWFGLAVLSAVNSTS